MKRKIDAECGFLNVDLDVYSRVSLAPLAAELEPKAFVLYAGRKGDGYAAHFELRAFPKSADAAVQGLAALIRNLSPKAKRLWNGATNRDFNIGIQTKAAGHAGEIGLSARTVGKIAALQGRILITVYPTDLKVFKIDRKQKTRRRFLKPGSSSS
jgi:hypothetical protein